MRHDIRSSGLSRCHFFLGCLLVSFPFVFNLIKASRFYMPLGDDGTIYNWPVGYHLTHESSFSTKLKILVASFLGEDHLAPIQHLYGYLLHLFAEKPEPAILIGNKLAFIVIAASSIIIFNHLYRDSKRTFIFALMLAMNGHMTAKNLLSNSLSIIPSLWTIYFLIKYLETTNYKNLALSAILLCVATLTFETSFILFPVVAIFPIWHWRELPVRRLVRKCAFVASVYGVAFLPYLVIHKMLYDSFIPKSRAHFQPTFAAHARMTLGTISSWLYDIPRWLAHEVNKVALLGILILLGAGLYRFRSSVRQILASWPPIEDQSKGLLISVLFQLALIAYTGRQEPGMWTFAGILFLFGLSDIVHSGVTRFFGFRRGFAGLFLLLAPFCFFENRIWADAETWYAKPNLESLAGYEAIAENTKNIAMIKLPSARSQLHPIMFWLGNQIFHGDPGMDYFPSHHVLLPRSMNVASFSNPNNLPFDRIAGIIGDLIESPSAVVANDVNSYTRFYGPNHKIGYESVLVLISETDASQVELKPLHLSHRDAKITLDFSGCKSEQEVADSRINVNGQPLRLTADPDNCSRFSTLLNFRGLKSPRLLNVPTSDLILRKVFISNLDGANAVEPIITATTTVNIRSAVDCRFFVEFPDEGVRIIGTVHPGSTTEVSIPGALQGKTGTVQYTPFALIKDSSVMRQYPLKIGAETIRNIDVCN